MLRLIRPQIACRRWLPNAATCSASTVPSWAVSSLSSSSSPPLSFPVTRRRQYSKSTQILATPFEPYEGVSEETSKVIYDHAMQPQTSVSLQALMRTGKGEFLHKTFEDTKNMIDEHSASELVLIQVRTKPNLPTYLLVLRKSLLVHSIMFLIFSIVGR